MKHTKKVVDLEQIKNLKILDLRLMLDLSRPAREGSLRGSENSKLKERSALS